MPAVGCRAGTSTPCPTIPEGSLSLTWGVLGPDLGVPEPDLGVGKEFQRISWKRQGRERVRGVKWTRPWALPTLPGSGGVAPLCT